MLANVENMQGASEDTQAPPAVSSDECASNASTVSWRQQGDPCISPQPVHSFPNASSAARSNAIACEISQRMRQRRKDLHFSQSVLAHRSGVSLGSLKRFEQDSLISLESLIKLSVALGCEKSFAALFSQDDGCEQKEREQDQEHLSLEDIVAQGHRLLDRIVLLESGKA